MSVRNFQRGRRSGGRMTKGSDGSVGGAGLIRHGLLRSVLGNRGGAGDRGAVPANV